MWDHFGTGAGSVGFLGNRDFLLGACSDLSSSLLAVFDLGFRGDLSVFLVARISISLMYDNKVAAQAGGTIGEKGVP